MVEPLVLAVDISRRFGSGASATEAVHPASCMIYPGERIALVGPSGSGKSTLLHLLGGLDNPTSGSVSWPSLGPRESLRPSQIVDIFQGPSLLPPLSVIENVRLPLLLSGLSEKRSNAVAGQALTRFRISHLQDKFPEEISGGQAQRAAIARALAVGPALLLADEPTGQLDSATAQEVLSTLLEALRAGGSAAVIATHDPLVATRLDAVWRMTDGYLAVSDACSI